MSRRDSETLHWILTHTDNENFDKKLRLVRPCTDDEVLLRALNQLSELRRIVSPLFYNQEAGRALAVSDPVRYAPLKQGAEKDAEKELSAEEVEQARLLSAINCRHFKSLEHFLSEYTALIKFTYAKQENSELRRAGRGAAAGTALSSPHDAAMGDEGGHALLSPRDRVGNGDDFRETEQLISLKVVTQSFG